MRIDPRQMSAKLRGGVNVVQRINPAVHMRSICVDKGVVDSLSPELFLDFLGAKGLGPKTSNANPDRCARLIFDLNPDGHSDRRSEEHTSELQSRPHLVCRLLLEKKKKHV